MAADFDQIAERLGQITPIIRQATLTLVRDLQRAAVSHARLNLLDQRAIDTRGTLNGIEATEPQATSTGWRGEVRATAPQSIFVERGRGAGKRMPPGGALLGWMQRHGIPANREFVVRRAIGRRGIRPRPFIGPVPRQVEPERAQLVARARESIRAQLVAGLQG